MLYQNPAIQSRVEVHLVEEAKGGPSKLLLSFLSLEETGRTISRDYRSTILERTAESATSTRPYAFRV
jgi:hypothetical protein